MRNHRVRAKQPGGGGSLALPSWARDDGVVTVAVALLYAVVATSMSVINR